LLEESIDIDQCDEKHASALNQAAANNRFKVIELLLDHEADILLPGPNGSALDSAIHHGHREAAIILLARGAKVNIDTEKSAIAMKHALRYNYSSVVDLILSFDAFGGSTIEDLESDMSHVSLVPPPTGVSIELASRKLKLEQS
jgi:ankyrin repeat protein